MVHQLTENHHDGPTLLIVTDACRQAGHRLADPADDADGQGSLICVTCTEEWGRLQGLRTWQENCPCCFSAAYPNGLADLGITAEPRPSHGSPNDHEKATTG